MIGLYTGGAWLAERLHAMLRLPEPLGLMDIAFYRDDYHARGLHHDPKRTKIPFDINGRDLLLVDDVLYRSEEHTSELQSRPHLVCRLLLEKKKKEESKRLEICKETELAS